MAGRLSALELEELVARIGGLDDERAGLRLKLIEQVQSFGWLGRCLKTRLFHVHYENNELTIQSNDNLPEPSCEKAAA